MKIDVLKDSSNGKAMKIHSSREEKDENKILV